MITDERVPFRQRRLREQWQKRTADVAAVDEQHWLSRPLQFVFQLDAVHSGSLHRSSSPRDLCSPTLNIPSIDRSMKTDPAAYSHQGYGTL
jgi:hypothetical protein